MTRSTASRSSFPMIGFAAGIGCTISSPPVLRRPAAAVRRFRCTISPVFGHFQLAVPDCEQRHAGLADPLEPPRRDPGDQREVWHVLGHHRTSGHGRPAADGDRRHADRLRAPSEQPSFSVTPTGSQSCAALRRTVRVHRAREVVVGQHHGRADEHAVLERRPARTPARSSGSCSCRRSGPRSRRRRRGRRCSSSPAPRSRGSGTGARPTIRRRSGRARRRRRTAAMRDVTGSPSR